MSANAPFYPLRMDGESRRTTTYVEIDGREYTLGRDLDLVDVMSKIQAAAQSRPTFVDLADSAHLVSVLVSPQSRVVITVRPESSTPEHLHPSDAMSDWDL